MIVELLLYLSLATLIVGTAIKTLKIIRMPVHLRWDLYPIPHEKGKGRYGGSYFEESEWWTKPPNFSLLAEVKEVAKEILAIKSLFRNNRSLWYFSYPFHIGLYLLIIFSGLLVLGGALQAGGVEIAKASSSLPGMVIFELTIVCGLTGFILGAIGALGLLLSRMLRGELRRYSNVPDYFNLLLLLAIFICGFLSWLTVDRSFSVLRNFGAHLILFKSVGNLPAIVSAQLILTSIFFIYLPFTHMTHFVGKFFTYHKVRWQDEPNRRGSGTESEILEALQERLSWSAPHIKTGKSWGEAASDDSDGNESK